MTTNRANLAIFKSKTLALLDSLKFEPHEIVALGLTMSVAHGLVAGNDRATLHKLLDLAIDEALAAPVGGVANDE